MITITGQFSHNWLIPCWLRPDRDLDQNTDNQCHCYNTIYHRICQKNRRYPRLRSLSPILCPRIFGVEIWHILKQYPASCIRTKSYTNLMNRKYTIPWGRMFEIKMAFVPIAFQPLAPYANRSFVAFFFRGERANSLSFSTAKAIWTSTQHYYQGLPLGLVFT